MPWTRRMARCLAPTGKHPTGTSAEYAQPNKGGPVCWSSKMSLAASRPPPRRGKLSHPEMTRQMFQENVPMGMIVLKLDMLFFGRSHHVAMDAGKILEGVQFRDQRAFCRARRRRQKHHFHGILPMIDQLFGQLIAAFGPLLDVV